MEFAVDTTKWLLRVTLVCVVMWTLLLTEPCSGVGPCTGISCLIGCSAPPSKYRDKHLTTNENQDTYNVDYVVMYQCQENYTTQGGSPYSRCNNLGTWTIPTLKCRGHHFSSRLHNMGLCGNPPLPPPHSIIKRVDQPVTSGSKAYYGCESQYKYISGQTHARCTRHGQWHPKEISIKCQGHPIRPRLCGNPPSPPAHSIIKRVDRPLISGSKAHYACDSGYKYIIGPTHSRCTRHGQWHPKVILINCQLPHSTSGPTSTVPTRPVSDADPQDRRGLSTKSMSIHQVTSGPTSTVPTRPISDDDPQDRRGFSTESVNNDAGVYQERVSSGLTLHNTRPFILLSPLLYQITDVI